jgi:hypothetical protein
MPVRPCALHQQYRQAARKHYHKDGEIEIDVEKAPVSEVKWAIEEGAYVQAWVWVPRHWLEEERKP